MEDEEKQSFLEIKIEPYLAIVTIHVTWAFFANMNVGLKVCLVDFGIFW